MPSGGARLRSGPAPDPNSARSERLGRMNGQLVLPVHGYRGTPPEFPLEETINYDREVELWNELWTTPQAAAWATMPYMHRTVAMYVRYVVRAEDLDAPANVMTTALRMADTVGLTVSGLAGLGWVIDNDDIVVRTDDPTDDPKVVSMEQRRRLPGDSGGSN